MRYLNNAYYSFIVIVCVYVLRGRVSYVHIVILMIKLKNAKGD